MGVVYRAEDTTLGRTVALKFLSPQVVQDPKRVEHFRDEARTASSLNHPNICTIYEVGEQDGEMFIAMEYVEGRPLSEFLREKGMAVETVLSPVLVLNDDTAFKYTITVDGKRYDPQIIIMGGN